jgi:hypothetical protein
LNISKENKFCVSLRQFMLIAQKLILLTHTFQSVCRHFQNNSCNNFCFVIFLYSVICNNYSWWFY